MLSCCEFQTHFPALTEYVAYLPVISFSNVEQVGELSDQHVSFPVRLCICCLVVMLRGRLVIIEDVKLLNLWMFKGYRLFKATTVVSAH